jgi:hypothetical protein
MLTPFSEFMLITLSVLEIILFSTFLILGNVLPMQTAMIVRNNPDEDFDPPDIWRDNTICVLLLGGLWFFNYGTLFSYMIVQMFAQNLYHQVVIFKNNIQK